MANISDLIMQQVKAAVGGVQVPADAQSKLIEGMSSSVLGSLTQTVAKPGGADLIKSLLSGKTSAASSPVTQLAGNLFTKNVLSKLNLGSALNGILSGLITGVMGKLASVIAGRDGAGAVDLNDILLSLKGGSGGGILGAATGILGGLVKKT